MSGQGVTRRCASVARFSVKAERAAPLAPPAARTPSNKIRLNYTWYLSKEHGVVAAATKTLLRPWRHSQASRMHQKRAIVGITSILRRKPPDLAMMISIQLFRVSFQVNS